VVCLRDLMATPRKLPHERKKLGRPEIQVDLGLVRGLAAIGCTDEDIALLVGISKSTLFNRKQDDPEFLSALEKGRAEIRMSLRRKQVEIAKAGNVTMLIWLGKQLLDQTDRRDLTGTLGSQPGDVTIRIVAADEDGADDEPPEA
jgi:hypothetical protein